MAIKKGKFTVGSIGNVVFKVRMGVQIMQSTPGKGRVRQTDRTKKTASLFGKGSALAKAFRNNLRTIVQNNYDESMVYRMTTAVSAIVRQCYDAETETYSFNPGSFNNLVGFELNASSPLKKSLWLSPQSEFEGGILKVTIPEVQVPGELKFPKGTTNCLLKISFCLFNLEGGYVHRSPDIRQLEIQSDQGILQQQEFEFKVPEGCLCIVGVVLNYYKTIGTLAILANSKAFSPSAICAAYINPGDFEPERPAKWDDNKKAALQ